MSKTSSREELQLLFSLAFGVHDVLRETWHDGRTGTFVVATADRSIRKVRVILGDSGRWSVNPVTESPAIAGGWAG